MRAGGLRRSLVGAALAAAVAVAVAAVMLVRGGLAPAPPPADRDMALAAALDRVLLRREQSPAPGVAVRPLATPSGDAEAAALAGPLCDALVGRLARVPALRVASCGSSGVAYAADLDDAALSRLLAVGHVVAGELRSLPGGRVRVRLALRDVRDGQRRWSVDEEMARADLQRLPGRLAQGAAPVFGRAHAPAAETTLPAAAYDRYTRALQLFRRASIDDQREALRLLDEVLATAADHAPSLYLRLALRARLDGYAAGGPAAQGDAARIAQAQAALHRETEALGERMVARDPGDRRGRTLLLNAALGQGRWEEAFRHADALLEHAHQQPGVLRIAARLHLMAGYVRQAEAYALEAARLDALDAESIEYLATTRGMQGRDDAMRELLAIAAQLGHGGLALPDAVLAHRRGDWPAFERAMTAYATATQRDAGWVPAYARGAADARERETAARLLDAHDEGLRFYMTDYFVEYALLGDVERTLRALVRHARHPPKVWLEYLWWPELAAARRDPRFADVAGAIGLARLWDVRGAPDLCRRDAEGRWGCT